MFNKSSYISWFKTIESSLLWSLHFYWNLNLYRLRLLLNDLNLFNWYSSIFKCLLLQSLSNLGSEIEICLKTIFLKHLRQMKKTYTVLPLIWRLILFKSSQNRVIADLNISISSSVHLLLLSKFSLQTIHWVKNWILPWSGILIGLQLHC